MTEEQMERMKMQQRMLIHTGIRVEERYPQVVKIDILHVREHTSAFGASHKEGVWTITPQSEACFVLECLNRECSTIGFDLQSAISAAIREGKTEVSGEMRCEGQEAPDHPEQSCDGKLTYTIRITYKSKE